MLEKEGETLPATTTIDMTLVKYQIVIQKTSPAEIIPFYPAHAWLFDTKWGHNSWNEYKVLFSKTWN